MSPIEDELREMAQGMVDNIWDACRDGAIQQAVDAQDRDRERWRELNDDERGALIADRIAYSICYGILGSALLLGPTGAMLMCQSVMARVLLSVGSSEIVEREEDHDSSH